VEGGRLDNQENQTVVSFVDDRRRRVAEPHLKKWDIAGPNLPLSPTIDKERSWEE
jgi:hypothetical protein